jgi:hypothetical protein
MRTKLLVGTTVLALAVAMVTSACVEMKREATTPMSPSASPSSPSSSPSSQVSNVLNTGAWASTTQRATSSFNPGECGNFQWQITTLTTTSATGTFSAVCAGGLALKGSAEGKLEGVSATITVSGTGSSPTIPSCTFSISAVAVPQTLDTVKLTYSGNVCGMTTSGSEILKKP